MVRRELEPAVVQAGPVPARSARRNSTAGRLPTAAVAIAPTPGMAAPSTSNAADFTTRAEDTYITMGGGLRLVICDKFDIGFGLVVRGDGRPLRGPAVPDGVPGVKYGQSIRDSARAEAAGPLVRGPAAYCRAPADLGGSVCPAEAAFRRSPAATISGFCHGSGRQAPVFKLHQLGRPRPSAPKRHRRFHARIAKLDKRVPCQFPFVAGPLSTLELIEIYPTSFRACRFQTLGCTGGNAAAAVRTGFARSASTFGVIRVTSSMAAAVCRLSDSSRQSC